MDVVLRGHLHEDEIESVASVHGQALNVTGGAAYDTRKWPNRALYCTIKGNSVKVYPIRYENQPMEVWTTDPSVFPHEPGHEKSFPIPRLTETIPAPESTKVSLNDAAPLPRFRSNIPSRLNKPFVGRDELIVEIQKNLDDPAQERALVLHGQPGVGKSELARECARRQRDRYPGGTFFVDFSAGAPPIDLATIGKNVLGLNFPRDLGLPDQCQQVLLALGSTPSLVIYDNVCSMDAVTPWLPPAGMPCHVLITTIMDWCEPGWSCLIVEPLTEDASLQLVKEIGGSEIAEKYGKEVAAGGLPVQILPLTAMLAKEQRRGRLDSARLILTSEAEKSFRGAFERLESPARLLLRSAAFLNPQRIPREELFQHLREPTGWTEAEFLRLLDACLDLHLIEGNEDLRMHQLFAAFVLSEPQSNEIEAILKEVRRVQARRLIEIARGVRGNPADSELAAALMIFPLKPEAWADTKDEVTIAAGETIGRALIEIGHFTDALPWHTRAVEAAEKGDVRGRVDNDSLGSSLHQVGFCLGNIGNYKDALPWFKRAVEAKRKGDVHGRVDRKSVALSLRVGAECQRKLGNNEEEVKWEEEAAGLDPDDDHSQSTMPNDA